MHLRPSGELRPAGVIHCDKDLVVRMTLNCPSIRRPCAVMKKAPIYGAFLLSSMMNFRCRNPMHLAPVQRPIDDLPGVDDKSVAHLLANVDTIGDEAQAPARFGRAPKAIVVGSHVTAD